MELRAFIFRRLVSSVTAVLGVSVLVFLFLHMVPGDPVDNLLGAEATDEQREAITRCMHLDRPLLEQFGIFLGNVANGTLGRQCPDAPGKPTVLARIMEDFPYTIRLALAASLVALLLALPLGVLAAVRRGTLWDSAAMVVSLAGISIPNFWLAPLFIFVFYLQLGWFPGPAEVDDPLSIVMPAIVLGTALMAMLSRMTRSSLLEVLHEDYMRTARAKGLPPRTVVYKHGLRNALLPVITVVGLQLGGLLAGAVIVEKIFSRPGIGKLLYDAIMQRNYPLVQGCVLVIAICYVVVNLLVDLTYGVADPRIRKT